jgi:excisionase family DNA binding protein
MEDELLTVEEVAAKLRLSTATVRRLLARGDIQARKMGVRQWRVSAAALRAYIEGSGPAPVDPPMSRSAAPADASFRDGHKKPRPAKAAPKAKTAAKKPPAKRK